MTVTKDTNKNTYNFDLLKKNGYSLPENQPPFKCTPELVDIHIKGKVTDNNGNPVSDATVKFIPDKPNPNIIINPAKTDA